MSSYVSGTLAELLYDHRRDGERVFLVEYWRGGEDGEDEKVRREFDSARAACRFMATIATNKSRAWSRWVVEP